MRYGLWTSLLSVVVVTRAVLGEPLAPGAWLVDLGRDYPRTPQAGASDVDAEITLALMQAASRVEPNLAEAYLWQYDMLTALDRSDAAREALANYVRLQPDDVAAHLNWIALEVDRLQTAESRAEFCRKTLEQPKLPSNVASDLHRRLAQFHLDRGEREKAAAEATAAIRAYDLNFAARQLLELAKLPMGSAPAEQSEVSELLLAVSASPNDPDLARLAGHRLLVMNLPEPAERFYAHAIALLRILDVAGQLPQAMTERAVALQMMGKEQEYREQIQQADEQWRALLSQSQGKLDPFSTAQMAWFYAFFVPQPEQAEKLARVAVDQEPDLMIAHRALGSALRQLGRIDEAKKELEPIANADAAAASEYARVLAAQKQAQGAEQVMEKAATQPASPIGEIAMQRAAQDLGGRPPASRPAPTDDVEAVQRFPWAVLDYPLRPDKYVSLKLAVPAPDLAPGEPWLVTARLTNIGAFPITLGADMMVAPDLLVSVTTQGDKERTTGPTLRFSLNRTPRLMPGESVAVTHTVDVGAIRSGMIGTPQMAHEVTVSGVLSPMLFANAQGQEVVAPGIGGLLSEPLKFRRTAFAPTDQNMHKVMSGLRSADPLTRINAMELLAMLIAEQQHLAGGRLQYSARRIDAPAVQAAVLSMAADPEWYVRARLAEALRWFSLDKTATNTATALLSDPHWLVRGVAMRTLADHYGAKFSPVLAKAAQADPDEWVRRLCGMLNTRVQNSAEAATQPAQ